MHQLSAKILTIVLSFIGITGFSQTPVIDMIRTSGWNPDGSAIITNASEFPESDYSWEWMKLPNQLVQVGNDTLFNQNVGEYQLIVYDLINSTSTTTNFYIGGDCSIYGYADIDSAIIVNAVPGNDIGYIEPLVIGGNGGYTWSWSNGSTTMVQSGLSAGVYTATVTDAFYCSSTATYEIIVDSNGVSPFEPNLQFSYLEPWASYAVVQVSPTGGIPPYTTEFSNGTIMNGSCGSAYDYAGNWTGLQYATVYDSGGDTVVVHFIISGEETTFGNIPYPDSIIENSIYCGIIENCDIDYQNVDSASVYSIINDSLTQQLYITWAVYTSTNTFYLYDTVAFAGTPGLYTIQVSAYCPEKSLGDYLTILEQIELEEQSATVSINENSLDDILLAPNPFQNEIYLYGTDLISEVKLSDVLGREIHTSLIYEKNRIQIVIEDHEVSEGTYYLSLTNAAGSKSFKIIH